MAFPTQASHIYFSIQKLFLTSFNTPSVAEYDEEASDAYLSGEADDALIEAAEPWRILKVGLLVNEVGRLDRLFEDAVRLVVEKDRCNTALL